MATPDPVLDSEKGRYERALESLHDLHRQSGRSLAESMANSEDWWTARTHSGRQVAPDLRVCSWDGMPWPCQEHVSAVTRLVRRGFKSPDARQLATVVGDGQ